MGNDNIPEAKKWEESLSAIACHVQEEFHRQNPFADDGDVSPNIVALRDAFHAFPVAADVLLIDAGSTQTTGHIGSIFMRPDFVAGPIWTLIAHHLDDASTKGITFHGVRPLADLDNFFPLLSERFGLDDESYREDIKSLRFSGCWTWDCSLIVDFVPYNISERPTDYARYLTHNLLGSHTNGLIERFKKEIDYSELYGLGKDPILPLEELTKKDDRTAMFVKFTGEPLSIEDWQEDVCGVQLISRVPQDVQETFRRAKDAYIFGYFRYEFHTMAVHYASLALEAAIKARWSATLPQAVTLSYETKKNEAKCEMHFPSHTKIFKLCIKEHWEKRRCSLMANRSCFLRRCSWAGWSVKRLSLNGKGKD